MELKDSVIKLKGVGSEVEAKLAVLGLNTVGDLINNYPRKYVDYSNIQSIENISPGLVTIRATIKQSTGRYVNRGLHVTEAIASDETGSVRIVWFNQPYRAAGLKNGESYYISGEFALRSQKLSIQNPSIELVSEFPTSTARIIPIYRETKGLKSHQIRRLVKQILPIIESLPETLPVWINVKQSLVSRSEAISNLHFPTSADHLLQAQRRLGFEEVFELSLAALLNKQELQGEHALSIPFDEKLAKKFVMNLPFILTDAQRKAVWQIYLDMERNHPMNRLLEGDVGSGKTVVAAMAAVMVMQQGFQVALMAPTELLARQHANSLSRLLEPLGAANQVGLLVGGLKPSAKKLTLEAIKNGKLKFIIGTHALIQEKVDIKKLGFIIIDEQHRFGVEQRKKLQSKAGHMPHVLSLTATPIPRSLALTLYGEMDVSIIDAKPLGRKPIITKIVSAGARPQLYRSIELEILAGRQVFIVCPTITDSDVIDVESVERTYETLRKSIFKHHNVGLLHGKMKSEEKEAIMQEFIDKKIDILVSTTVIEVGVDVPNASVMVIENAERFGLAQMHQLRGRVGRSEQQGYCYLILASGSQPSRRLRALETSQDGFKLAELDLDIRGPGEIYGRMQHGQLDLRIAKLTDMRLIASARNTAQQFIDKKEDLLQYKLLSDRVSTLRSVTNLN